MSDSEYFVDQPIKPIPPADTWENMSVNQLLEVQSVLTSRAWDFRNNQPVLKGIQSGLSKLEALITARLNDV